MNIHVSKVQNIEAKLFWFVFFHTSNIQNFCLFYNSTLFRPKSKIEIDNVIKEIQAKIKTDTTQNNPLLSGSGDIDDSFDTDSNKGVDLKVKKGITTGDTGSIEGFDDTPLKTMSFKLGEKNSVFNLQRMASDIIDLKRDFFAMPTQTEQYKKDTASGIRDQKRVYMTKNEIPTNTTPDIKKMQSQQGALERGSMNYAPRVFFSTGSRYGTAIKELEKAILAKKTNKAMTEKALNTAMNTALLDAYERRETYAPAIEIINILKTSELHRRVFNPISLLVALKNKANRDKPTKELIRNHTLYSVAQNPSKDKKETQTDEVKYFYTTSEKNHGGSAQSKYGKGGKNDKIARKGSFEKKLKNMEDNIRAYVREKHPEDTKNQLTGQKIATTIKAEVEWLRDDLNNRLFHADGKRVITGGKLKKSRLKEMFTKMNHKQEEKKQEEIMLKKRELVKTKGGKKSQKFKKGEPKSISDYFKPKAQKPKKQDGTLNSFFKPKK